ncbi:STAS domain-containing protein [Nonomuraea rhodomycinica]|uniref:Anti-sigma factor antagonist n=1 Tax=Nonomuraea rhodomycinica TaxID=1712872 RepID=A0A7Y6IJB0_9ACTN|nr:STAS domain-containing protein [Nonomuraea rhodomycinica]NUW38725.1 STAS domain-containing protein [Nonomuraea rhodomycinica]
MTMLTLTTRRLPGASVIVVGGEVDAVTADQLEDFIRDACPGAGERLVLDLSEMPFMASPGLRVLITADALLRDAGGSLHLAGMRPAPARLLEITGTADVLRIHATVDHALTAPLNEQDA